MTDTAPTDTAPATVHDLVAERITVSGIVQGVGFRPFVYRLAHEHRLTGHVGNDSTQVFIEVCGARGDVDEFAARLVTDAPPLALVEHVDRRATSPAPPADGFSIVESRTASGARTLVAPDTAVCDDCLAELLDPADRRHRHPFITCTNCGPRFTIIRSLPYDRPATTMATFPMCARCAEEYRDPGDRRYHAQPIACHDCGPVLRWIGEFDVEGAEGIDLCRGELCTGRTVAVKGVGGFHLVCDATNDDAVELLRSRKHRPDKPFAVMVRNLAQAETLAEISAGEAAMLQSPARPIVLLRARPDGGLSSLVAPGNPLIGVMLAYTPVHHLMLEGMPPLVVTSANRGGTPIVHRDEDLDRLDELCDGVLTHDRPIHVPCDDSVVRLVGDRLLPIRRARGYAPIPVALPGARRSVLAVGAELKNTFCVTDGDHAWVSQHIGDMENLETLRAFESTVGLYETMYGVTPAVVAVDTHPGYLSTSWARTNRRGPLLGVQHHHAHVAAVMAEHGLDPHRPVIGVAFDGTGYGDDGAIWGGEVLAADADGYERVAHLTYTPLPGGDAAIRNPCRVALAHLWSAGVAWRRGLAPVDALDDVELGLLERQLTRDVACVPTSSMGRLFDAVASLLGLRQHITYEAQAAIDLEIAAADGTPLDPYRFEFSGTQIDARPVVRSIVADLDAGRSVVDVARTFHLAVADLVVAVALRERAARRLDTVALSGGVFQNSLLTGECVDRLEAAGFTVLTHHLVPPNDGGLALGQAYVAAHRSEI